MRQLHLPDNDKIFVVDLHWHEESQRYIAEGAIVPKALDVRTLFFTPNDPDAPGPSPGREVQEWLAASMPTSVEFSEGIVLELLHGQPAYLTPLTTSGGSPAWLKVSKSVAVLESFRKILRHLDAAGFGWQKKERFLGAIEAAAKGAGVGCLVEGETHAGERALKSIRRTIAAGREDDRGGPGK